MLLHVYLPTSFLTLDRSKVIGMYIPFDCAIIFVKICGRSGVASIPRIIIIILGIKSFTGIQHTIAVIVGSRATSKIHIFSSLHRDVSTLRAVKRKGCY